MNIVISGSTGMIGSFLTNHFRLGGHRILPLRAKDIQAGKIEQEKLEGQDVIIHLAGASISKPWTKEYKKLILSSRVESTRLLCQTLVQLKQKPRLLMVASAVGFYGDHPLGALLDESCPSGNGYLAEICRQWEEETLVASKAGIRVVNLRTGLVLSRSGGALSQMLPIFNFGLGGVLGNGNQMMSWVALGEIPLIADHIIQTETLSGPVNVVAPQAVQNREFTRVLGKIIKRPVFWPIPAWGIKFLFGSMGQELLLQGQQAIPAKLQSSGYVFKYFDLPSVLSKIILGRNMADS